MASSQKELQREIHQALMDALPADSVLRQKMDLCGTDSLGYFYTCRQPACFHCRRRYVNKQARAAKERFAACAKDDLAFLTVVLDPADSVEAIGDVVSRARTTVRNIFAKHRAASRKWRNAEMLGWIEVDALCADDAPLLGAERRDLVASLGVRLQTDEPTFLPTIHAIVSLGGLDWQQVRDAFQEKWPHARQVDVRPMYGHQPVEKSIACIVGYAMKRTCSTSLRGVDCVWPTSWLVDFELWTARWSRSFQSLRISVGKVKERRAKPKESVFSFEDNYYGAMPFVL